MSLYDDLLALVEELNEGPVSDDIKALIEDVINEAEVDEDTTAFDLLPESLAQQILGEGYDSIMGSNIPAQLMNAGAAYNGEITHDFKTQNKCPYFQKNELCALDGRVCLYDTETFPVCPRYKEGHTRGIPGLNGQSPQVTPQTELPRNPQSDMLPFNTGIKGNG